MRRKLHSPLMPRRPLLAALAAALAAAALLGCGSGDEEIPAGASEDLLAELTTFEEQFNAEDCPAADQSLTQLWEQVDDLGGGVDEDIRSTLRELFANLDSLFTEQCGGVTTTTTDTTETTTDTTDTTEPTTTDTTDTTTTTTDTTTTTTDTTTTDDTTNTTPGGGGGGGGTGGTGPGGDG